MKVAITLMVPIALVAVGVKSQRGAEWEGLGCYAKNLNIPGRSMSSEGVSNIRMVSAIASQEACQKLCQGETLCKQFTFITKTQWHPVKNMLNKGDCWLKTDQFTSFDGVVSGMNYCAEWEGLGCYAKNLNIPGRSMSSEGVSNIRMVSAIASQEACQKLCQDETLCKQFTFITKSQLHPVKNMLNRGDCWLKTDQFTSFDGVVSGMKYCDQESEFSWSNTWQRIQDFVFSIFPPEEFQFNETEP